MSKLSLEGVIICIPKQGKLRNTLKNWRPLTSLNTTYKFHSSMVANRLKLILPSVINEDQTGFISGRFIGENTRMIYDTINYCEEENKKGLLIILDFSKAFDTIEWLFIEDVFKIFNFGEDFINMIKLFQKNSTSRVEQNGHLSEPIILARDCRQGDPLLPYMSLYFVRRYCPMSSGRPTTLKVLGYMILSRKHHNMPTTLHSW